MSKPTDIRAYAKEQLKRLQKNLSEALASGDVEAVHDLRVASRRLEEPLVLCRGLARNKEIARLTKRLKRVRGAFSKVREWDVLQISLAKAVPQERERQTWDDLGVELTSRRASRLDKARKKCSRLDMQKLEAAVGSIFEQVDEHSGGSADWARSRLHELIDQRSAEVLRQAPAEGSTADLHRIRVGLKRLRYSLELREALESEPDANLIGQFKQMQDLLGDWNDDLQAAQRLSGLARDRQTLVERPEYSAGLLEHAGRRARCSQELAGQFLERWPDFQQVIRCLMSGPVQEKHC